MSEAGTKKKQPGMAQLVITLFVISAVCAVLLGLVNMITMDPIAKAKQQKTENAMQAVLAAESYSEATYTGSDVTIAKVYTAGDQGWVVEALPSGFGGAIDMMVGIKADGTVSGVSFISMAETSGLGANAKKDTFWSQFVGGAGPFSVTKDGGEIDSLTGATITSRAVADGVNAALEAVKTLG